MSDNPTDSDLDDRVEMLMTWRDFIKFLEATPVRHLLYHLLYHSEKFLVSTGVNTTSTY